MTSPANPGQQAMRPPGQRLASKERQRDKRYE